VRFVGAYVSVFGYKASGSSTHPGPARSPSTPMQAPQAHKQGHLFAI